MNGTEYALNINIKNLTIPYQNYLKNTNISFKTKGLKALS